MEGVSYLVIRAGTCATRGLIVRRDDMMDYLYVVASPEKSLTLVL